MLKMVFVGQTLAPSTFYLTWNCEHGWEEGCQHYHDGEAEEGVAEVDTADGGDLENGGCNQTLLSSDPLIEVLWEKESNHSTAETDAV